MKSLTLAVLLVGCSVHVDAAVEAGAGAGGAAAGSAGAFVTGGGGSIAGVAGSSQAGAVAEAGSSSSGAPGAGAGGAPAEAGSAGAVAEAGSSSGGASAGAVGMGGSPAAGSSAGGAAAGSPGSAGASGVACPYHVSSEGISATGHRITAQFDVFAFVLSADLSALDGYTITPFADNVQIAKPFAGGSVWAVPSNNRLKVLSFDIAPITAGALMPAGGLPLFCK